MWIKDYKGSQKQRGKEDYRKNRKGKGESKRKKPGERESRMRQSTD